MYTANYVKPLHFTTLSIVLLYQFIKSIYFTRILTFNISREISLNFF